MNAPAFALFCGRWLATYASSEPKVISPCESSAFARTAFRGGETARNDLPSRVSVFAQASSRAFACAWVAFGVRPFCAAVSTLVTAAFARCSMAWYWARVRLPAAPAAAQA